jgi:hypothetical protein
MRMMTDRKSLMLSNKEDLSRGDYLCLYPPTQLKVLAAQLRDQVSPDTMQDLLKQQRVLLIYENSEFQVYKLTYKNIPFMNKQLWVPARKRE